MSEFWELTPLELRVILRNHQKKLELDNKNRTNLAIAQAWMTANWYRAKRMPDLDKVLTKDKTEQKQMTDEQMLNQIKALNAMFGGAVNKDGTE